MNACRNFSRRRDSGAFTLIELLVSIAIIGILMAMLLPAVSRSKGRATGIACINHERQLAIAYLSYVEDHDGQVPFQSRTRRWPTAIFDNYKDTRLLLCPEDSTAAATWRNGDPVKCAPDHAPRSYFVNGWNDYYKQALDAASWDAFIYGSYSNSIKLSVVTRTSDTVLFGEKITERPDFYMDLLEYETNNLVGNDLFRMERSRHGSTGGSNSGTGGSNYAMVDGSAHFIKFADVLWPENLWAVAPANRTAYAVKP
jgi:prepilin-type N-terminal cleavage/methylation domain-containing protein